MELVKRKGAGRCKVQGAQQVNANSRKYLTGANIRSGDGAFKRASFVEEKGRGKNKLQNITIYKYLHLFINIYISKSPLIQHFKKKT